MGLRTLPLSHGQTDPSRNFERPMQGHRAILFSLRFFCVLQALAGVAFIVSSSLIVFPPVASAFIILLWIIGGFTIVVAIVGVLAAVPSRIKCCMTPYLTLTGELLPSSCISPESFLTRLILYSEVMTAFSIHAKDRRSS